MILRTLSLCPSNRNQAGHSQAAEKGQAAISFPRFPHIFDLPPLKKTGHRQRMDNSVFVHAQGLCESEDVGSGTRVWAFAHVMKGAKVGRDCNVGGGAFIESGAILGNGVTVKNNVLVWDKVIIEDEVFLGTSCRRWFEKALRSVRMRRLYVVSRSA
jgi:UDP-3-O-[3-hydroxymyristoyl] glucosamine N-acyltransferase